MIDAETMRLLAYFHHDKGDMDCHYDWCAIREELKTEHPALIAAYDALKVAKETLDALVAHTLKKIEDAEEEPDHG